LGTGYWKRGTASRFQTKACKIWFEHGRILRQEISGKVVAGGKIYIRIQPGTMVQAGVEEVKFMAASLQHSSAAAHKLQSCIGTCGEG